MPTYDYICKNCKHELELFQSMTEAPKKKCPQCGKNTLERQIGTGAAVMFKGSGFYETDYRSESYKKAQAADAEKAKPADAKAETKSEAKSEPKAETKPDAKPEPKSDAKAPAKIQTKAAVQSASKSAAKAGSKPAAKPARKTGRSS